MEPNVNQTQQTKKKSGLTAIVLAIVIVLLAGGYLGYSYTHPYGASYGKLSTFTLKDDAHHAGMSILKPDQFIWQPTAGLEGAKIVKQAAQARFVQSKNISGKQTIIAQMALNSAFTPPDLKSNNVQLVERLMSDTKDPGHSAVVLPLQNYASNLLNSNIAKPVYKLTFDQPSVLKGLDHAWVVSFQAVAKTPGRNTPDMQGEVVEVFGKNGQYFMAIDTAKANWQSNQSVWQQVINSLKVDQ